MKKKMVKKLALVVALIMSFGIIASCAPAAPAPAAPAPPTPAEEAPTEEAPAEEAPIEEAPVEEAPVAQGEPIRIGYIGDLTGGTAHWGQAGLNGMQLQADIINAAGGINVGGEYRLVEVHALDGRGQPEDSLNAFNMLLDIHDVVAVLGTNFSSINIPLAPIAGERGVPVIATAATNRLVTVAEDGTLHRYSFRLTFIDQFLAETMARYAFETMGYETAAILYAQDLPYSTGLTEFTIAKFEELGGEIVATEAANDADTDFRAQLTTIIASNPEVLFVPWILDNVALITRQARDLGFEGSFMGYDGWDSATLPELSGGAVEGSRFGSRMGFALPEAQAFADLYTAEFNIPLEGEILFGHDGLMWILSAIERAGSTEPSAIRDELANPIPFDGLLGRMTIDPQTHNPNRDVGIFEVVDGINVLVEVYS